MTEALAQQQAGYIWHQGQWIEDRNPEDDGAFIELYGLARNPLMSTTGYADDEVAQSFNHMQHASGVWRDPEFGDVFLPAGWVNHPGGADGAAFDVATGTTSQGSSLLLLVVGALGFFFLS